MDKTNYILVHGIYYHKNTSKKVLEVLEKIIENKARIVIDYGDIKTGKSWNEISGVTGKVGLSTGPMQIPILLYSKRSVSGPAINTQNIISIKTSLGKHLIYSQ